MTNQQHLRFTDIERQYLNDLAHAARILAEAPVELVTEDRDGDEWAAFNVWINGEPAPEPLVTVQLTRDPIDRYALLERPHVALEGRFLKPLAWPALRDWIFAAKRGPGFRMDFIH
jgi:hypothetical protein